MTRKKSWWYRSAMAFIMPVAVCCGVVIAAISLIIGVLMVGVVLVMGAASTPLLLTKKGRAKFDELREWSEKIKKGSDK